MTVPAKSSAVLEQLAQLRQAIWLQDFAATPAQQAQMRALRLARWARVAELTPMPE